VNLGKPMENSCSLILEVIVFLDGKAFFLDFLLIRKQTHESSKKHFLEITTNAKYTQFFAVCEEMLIGKLGFLRSFLMLIKKNND